MVDWLYILEHVCQLEHFKTSSHICAKHYKLSILCLVKLWCILCNIKGEERTEGKGLRMWAHQRKVHVWRENRETQNVYRRRVQSSSSREASSWHASHYYTRQACMNEYTRQHTHTHTHTHAQNFLPNASFIARHLEWFWLSHFCFTPF